MPNRQTSSFGPRRGHHSGACGETWGVQHRTWKWRLGSWEDDPFPGISRFHVELPGCIYISRMNSMHAMDNGLNISWFSRLKFLKKIIVLENQIVIKSSKSMIVGSVNASNKTQAIEVSWSPQVSNTNRTWAKCLYETNVHETLIQIYRIMMNPYTSSYMFRDWIVGLQFKQKLFLEKWVVCPTNWSLPHGPPACPRALSTSQSSCPTSAGRSLTRHPPLCPRPQ